MKNIFDCFSEVQKIFLDAKLKIPETVKIKNSTCGCSSSKSITIPKWLLEDKFCIKNINKANQKLKELNMQTINPTPTPDDYRKFYIAHEITHFNLQTLSHQKPFYTILKKLNFDIRLDIFYMKKYVLEALNER